MAANLKRRYTLEEYFELERSSDEKYEFWNGEIYCMSGASEAHDEVETNIISHLKPRVASRKSQVPCVFIKHANQSSNRTALPLRRYIGVVWRGDV